ncbi:glycosyltransferase family 52 [Streptococcus hillyeri]|uniref:Capsular biosynthesis protein n=1 Tax=Streptococcus hillyeri TaxID=2282420 RepID=A0A3L9DLM7_9STRE|nr:glycosyltransferase family 52 [Streptococcus hillyeri]RLY02426.1 capsular biosynthesis protein [Streptococcus hillyeri]
MKKLYVCSTVYHLIVALLKINLEEYNKIVLLDGIVDAEKFCLRLNEIDGIEAVVFTDNLVYSRYPIYKQEQLDMMDKLLEKVKEIYMFIDANHIGWYLHRKKINYHLLEDGYNCFLYPSQHKYSWWRFFLKGIPKVHGYSKYCIDIEANSIAGIPRDSRYNKFIEVPRKQLFEEMEVSKKEIIFNLFDYEPIKIQQPSVLILTQPLHSDVQWGMSYEEHIQFYSKIVEKYSDYHIYLKVHPRDYTDYSKFNATILSNSYPIEILDIFGEHKFNIGITHSSTALDFLNCVEEKIVLFDLKDMT